MACQASQEDKLSVTLPVYYPLKNEKGIEMIGSLKMIKQFKQCKKAKYSFIMVLMTCYEGALLVEAKEHCPTNLKILNFRATDEVWRGSSKNFATFLKDH